MELFYNKDIDVFTNNFDLSIDETRHITKVLRKKEGETLDFTNGKNEKFTCKIKEIKKNKCTVKVLNCLKYESQENLHIGISLLKLTSRFEIFLEKCVEIGIKEITPLICERTINIKFNRKRFEKILVSAMKQSYKFELPVLNDPVNFKIFSEISHENKLIATCEEIPEKNKISKSNFKKKNLVAIGPEGDFTLKEIELALKNNFHPISFGKKRLRTETAGIYTCVANSFNK